MLPHNDSLSSQLVFFSFEYIMKVLRQKILQLSYDPSTHQHIMKLQLKYFKIIWSLYSITTKLSSVKSSSMFNLIWPMLFDLSYSI